MQPSRRAFLLGRPAQRTPWQSFCHSLRRVCGGEFKPIPDTRQIRWTPDTVADVRQARALCAEFCVQLALVDTAVSVADASVLWVDPVRLNRLERLPGPPAGAEPCWRAGPGVTVGELARAGLARFVQAASTAPERTLAAWFADRSTACWPPGRGDLSGVLQADVLLADGVADTLGPFGAQDGQPLRTAALQSLVPALFRLSSGSGAQWCRAQSDWPARYRLDALLPQPPVTVNLAQMLHGHGGTLVWVEGLVLQSPLLHSPIVDADADADAGTASAAAPASADAPLMAQARALDARVKACFDPSGVFPEWVSR